MPKRHVIWYSVRDLGGVKLASRTNSKLVGTRFKRMSILFILAGIIVFSILASLALYSIQVEELNLMAAAEVNEVRNQLSEQSFYVSQLAGQHVASIKKITQILSNSKSFQSGEVDRIVLLLDAAKQESTEIVDSFFVFDKDGTLLYTTDTDPNAQSNIGNSFSDHLTYTQTKDTMKSFISPLVLGADNASRIFVASPIIDEETSEFKGTVSAAIRADTFANSIEKIVISVDQPNSESLALIDPEGRIMYAGASASNLGKNILSEEVQSAIPTGIREGLVVSLQEAVSGTAGIYELDLTEHPELMNSNTVESTTPVVNPIDYVFIAYNPIKVDDQTVMISLITKAASIKTIVHEHQISGGSNLFVLIYGMLGAMSAFAISIIVINKRLEKAVESKTRELENSNKQLREATEQISEQAKELREADIKKSEFSAMITHELKTPLVSIIGYGSMMLNGKLGTLNEMQKQKFEIIYRNAQRLVDLIQDILDVQKLELGKIHLNLRRVSAKDLIEQSMSSIKPYAESKRVGLSSSMKDDIMFECDSGRIIQVLNNLVNNGIKFSRPNSKVVVGAESVDHTVVFSVNDMGIGIPVDKQSKLFTKFYQADTSLTWKAGGTGLGLVISKGIVEAHRGKIWFESAAGKGSKFSFSLPVGESVGEKEHSSS